MNIRQTLTVAWRFARRELTGGELTALLLALTLSVSALSGVAFFSDRITRSLSTQATQLMAADLVLSTDQPASGSTINQAQQYTLQIAQSANFPSMVFANEQAQLATYKAVSSQYPLRGTLIIKTADGQEKTGHFAPEPGTAWADARLLRQLQLKPGDSIQAGDTTLKITAEIIKEPDATLDIYRFVPRLMFNLDDLPKTGLVQEGSRIRYRLMLAGNPTDIQRMQQWLTQHQPPGSRLENIEESRPEIRSGLERARHFLGLTALLTVILCAAAVGLAIRRYLARHWQSAAIFRCMGLTGTEVCRLFALLFFILAVMAGVIGTGLGYGIQQILVNMAKSWFDHTMPSPGWQTWLIGPLSAIIMLFGLALPPMAAIRKISALAVLRADLPISRPMLWAPLPPLIALFCLTIWQMADITQGIIWSTYLLGFIILISLLAFTLLKLLDCLPFQRQVTWRYGLMALTRRPWLSAIQLVALSVSLMALLTLTLVRTDLMSTWQQSIPAEAPNQFVVNIQPDQREGVTQAFKQQALTPPELSPMIRARLTAINGQPVQPEQYQDEHARRLTEREFNVSWRQQPPAWNQITAGQWWAPNTNTPQFSIEEGIAQTLNINMGDTLTFDIAGTPFQAPVTSLRKVNWDSFQVNFFVIAPESWIKDQPASYITSFYLPPGKNSAIDHIIARYPNLTFIDVSIILNEVRSMIEKMSAAIEAMFLLSLLAGILVLWTSLTSTRDERLYDAALMRTLGASHQQLRAIMLTELIWLGGLAGLLAGTGAMLLGSMATVKLFNLPFTLNGYLPLVGMGSGILIVILSGWPMLRKVVQTQPIRVMQHTRH